jgi:hypothetical protein
VTLLRVALDHHHLLSTSRRILSNSQPPLAFMSFPAPTSPLFPVAVSFVKALNARNFDAAEKLLAPAFLHRLFPASIRPTWAAHANREIFLVQAAEGYIENFGVRSRDERTTRPTSQLTLLLLFPFFISSKLSSPSTSWKATTASSSRSAGL